MINFILSRLEVLIRYVLRPPPGRSWIGNLPFFTFFGYPFTNRPFIICSSLIVFINPPLVDK